MYGKRHLMPGVSAAISAHSAVSLTIGYRHELETACLLRGMHRYWHSLPDKSALVAATFFKGILP
jgi:hypothetical protein